MDFEVLFYFAFMLFIAVITAIQIGKPSGDVFLNWFQLVTYVGTLVWFVNLKFYFGGTNSIFNFLTTFFFAISSAIEYLEFVKARDNKQKIAFPFFTFCVTFFVFFVSLMLVTNLI